MQIKDPSIDWQYRTVVIIWVAALVSQIFLFGLIYMERAELFKFVLSQPLLGENMIVVVLAAFFGLEGLVFSFIYRSRYLKQAVTEQDPELVQRALITSVALSESVSLWGVFLAFAFDYQYFFLWMGLGFLATIVHFPRKENSLNAGFKKLP